MARQESLPHKRCYHSAVSLVDQTAIACFDPQMAIAVSVKAQSTPPPTHTHTHTHTQHGAKLITPTLNTRATRTECKQDLDPPPSSSNNKHAIFKAQLLHETRGPCCVDAAVWKRYVAAPHTFTRARRKGKLETAKGLMVSERLLFWMPERTHRPLGDLLVRTNRLRLSTRIRHDRLLQCPGYYAPARTGPPSQQLTNQTTALHSALRPLARCIISGTLPYRQNLNSSSQVNASDIIGRKRWSQNPNQTIAKANVIPHEPENNMEPNNARCHSSSSHPTPPVPSSQEDSI